MADIMDKQLGTGNHNSGSKSKNHSITATEVTFEESIRDTEHSHACHCMVWSKWDDFVIEEFSPKAAILMQIRFDGCFGFPGGMVDEKFEAGITVDEGMEKCLNAITRELAEEMNVDFLRHVLTKKDYMSTHRHPTEKLYLHFFSFEMSLDGLKEVEDMALKAMDFGNEVLGVTRVPLYTMWDGHKGLPAFLNNNFIPCSRQQLLQGLEKLNIMTKEEIEKAVHASIKNQNTFK